MPVSFEIPDDGFASVKIGAASASVDLYSVNNKLIAIDAAVKSEMATASPAELTWEYLNRVCGLLEELGFGRCRTRRRRLRGRHLQGGRFAGKRTAPTPA